MKTKQAAPGVGVLVVVMTVLVLQRLGVVRWGTNSSPSGASNAEQSGMMIEAGGVVVRVLADDIEGDRHQRFIVELDDGHTLLIAHNIDLAPRVPLDRHDRVEFRGQYEWNNLGGVVHWTHHDPRGWREDGWIRHDGVLYQ